MGKVEKLRWEICNMEITIKKRNLYRRVIHAITLVTLFYYEFFDKDEEIIKGGIALLITVLCLFIGESFVAKENSVDCNSFRSVLIFQIVASNIFQLLFAEKFYIAVAFMILNADITYEYLVNENLTDKSGQSIKKLIVTLPVVINVIVKFSMAVSDGGAFGYMACQILLLSCVFYISDVYIGEKSKMENMLGKLTIEKADMEQANEQLMEYQDKIKAVNEQINYQKIDLSRAISELERVNAEAESQTEVMKYMASTFNITKCMSVIADAVMDIRKAKICALFVDGESFLSKFPSSVINTNYTSMQNRLNKDFEKIYNDVVANNETTKVYVGESVKKFKFIGEANIASLAVFPINNGERIYGIMIVGSDKLDYFDKGLAYFETSLAELNIAVKSIHLYLQMQDMARKDGLTGIYNRIYFKELFENASEEAINKKQNLSVALYDIDKFKSVNDTYGHLAGDEVIKMVASTGARYADRFGGFACRYGGEEFLLVLPGYDEKAALEVLEEMHDEIRKTKVAYHDTTIDVNCCIGLSSYPNICSNVELLVNRADKAMYYGKKNGRGRLVLDDPSIDEVI